jgi:hypothetical protein
MSSHHLNEGHKTPECFLGKRIQKHAYVFTHICRSAFRVDETVQIPIQCVFSHYQTDKDHIKHHIHYMKLERYGVVAKDFLLCSEDFSECVPALCDLYVFHA